MQTQVDNDFHVVRKKEPQPRKSTDSYADNCWNDGAGMKLFSGIIVAGKVSGNQTRMTRPYFDHRHQLLNMFERQ